MGFCFYWDFIVYDPKQKKREFEVKFTIIFLFSAFLPKISLPFPILNFNGAV